MEIKEAANKIIFIHTNGMGCYEYFIKTTPVTNREKPCILLFHVILFLPFIRDSVSLGKSNPLFDTCKKKSLCVHPTKLLPTVCLLLLPQLVQTLHPNNPPSNGLPLGSKCSLLEEVIILISRESAHQEHSADHLPLPNTGRAKRIE